MITFGLLSSLFDFLTFAVLILVLKSTPDEFRTGWFMVTIWTEFIVLWILRSKDFFMKSVPGKLLFYLTLTMFALTFLFPYTKVGTVIGLIPLPIDHLLLMILIVVLYAFANELIKRFFYRKVKL
jgi:Mg2+-importing ATPase